MPVHHSYSHASLGRYNKRLCCRQLKTTTVFQNLRRLIFLDESTMFNLTNTNVLVGKRTSVTNKLLKFAI